MGIVLIQFHEGKYIIWHIMSVCVFFMSIYDDPLMDRQL